MALFAVAVMPESDFAVMAGTAELTAPVGPLGDFSGIGLHQEIKLAMADTTGEFCPVLPVRKVHRQLIVCR